MATDDYFMRQIEGMGDMLSVLLTGKKSSPREEAIYDTQISAVGRSLLLDLRFLTLQGEINDAEDLLFERMREDVDENFSAAARDFYDSLEQMSDDTLGAANFSRAEIAEGREAVRRFYSNRQ